jgi:hypothetical protein
MPRRGCLRLPWDLGGRRCSASGEATPEREYLCAGAVLGRPRCQPQIRRPGLGGRRAGLTQRLRIASRLRSSQHGTLYVFDEPCTGLHPLDVAILADVFDRLLAAGATIIVIDHDL